MQDSEKNPLPEGTFVERAEEIYTREIIPILHALKSEEVSDEDYQTSVMDDLLGEVKNIQVLDGRLVTDPVTTMREVKNLLNRKIKKILGDASDYADGKTKKPKKVDAGLVRRAKIALLTENDFSDIGTLGYRGRKYIPIKDLKHYISGYDKSPCLSESELDALMRTPLRANLVNPKNSYDFFMDNYSKEVFVEKLPESLMIALTQAQTQRYGSNDPRNFILERALRDYAENGKYGSELIDHLLASQHGRLVPKYSEKFSGNIMEKVIRAGDWHISVIMDFLLKKNLPPDEFDKYVDCFVKNNKVHDLAHDTVQNKLVYSSNDLQTSVSLPYEGILEECLSLEKVPEGVDRDAKIELIIKRGYVSFLQYQQGPIPTLREYVGRNYQSFQHMIELNDQEHLVLPYLKSVDVQTYAHKLIERGEEYKLVRHLGSFPDDLILGKDIFDSLKKKDLALNLGEELGFFRGLGDEDALTYIENNQIQLFLDQFASFSLSAGFLQRPDIHDLCLKEFQSTLFSYGGNNLSKAKEIIENIPIPQDKVDAVLMETIRGFLGKEPKWWRAQELVGAFPHIRDFLETEEFQNAAKTELKKIKDPFWALRVLDTIPLSDVILQDKETIEGVTSAIRRRVYAENGENSFIVLFNLCDEIVRISKFISLPFDPERIRKALGVIEKLPLSLIVQQEYARKVFVSEDPEGVLQKLLLLQTEFQKNKRIASNENLLLMYVSKFFEGATQEEKDVFGERIMRDMDALSKNQPIDSENKEYYETLLKEVYPQRNYDTYKYIDQYEDRSSDLVPYQFSREGYDFLLSGVLGYRIKPGVISDDVLIKEFSERIATIKNIATAESLSGYLAEQVPDLQAKTLEGRILYYFKIKGYTVDTMNVLLAYQLLGAYENFVQGSADRVNLEENETSKNYILLDELVNQYGDNMKETIMVIQERVAQSEDRTLFSKAFQEKYEKKYADALAIITKDLAKIPRDKILDTTLQKKIAKTVKNVFQGMPEIQKLADNFSLFFTVNDLDTLQDVWEKHVDQLLVVDEGSRIDTEKVERLQAVVYTRLQSEIGKYEEVKEIDTERGEAKLSKDRVIKGYFSKNKENAHARMVADICVANDPNMLKNSKYFECVLFDEERKKCVGTIMLLEMNDPADGKKYLLYCPNPSVGLVSEVSAKRLYQILTKQVTQFANENGFDALLVDKGHGHSTNRAGLFQQNLEQSCLKDRTGKERIISLSNRHTLSGGYSYQNDLQIVWER